jgi:uncharacterized membrane protein YphA (DoxX/SURF4 family)/peroxiredoxin
MNGALVIARLCLSAVFFVAGLAKLADRSGTRQALADFDVPSGLAGPLLLLLPAAELAVATALLFPTTARWGAAGSLVLLALFVVGLTRVLRRGESPDCHCFGQVHSKPASWATVARNVVLAFLAAYVAVAGPGPSLVSWVGDTNTRGLWLIATGVLAALATTTAVVLWRENRRLRSSTNDRAAAAPRQIGALAPQFSLPSAAGRVVSLQSLLADDRACVLTFVHPGCGPCAALLPELARWHDTVTEHLALILVTAAEATEAEKLHEHALTDVLIDKQSTVMHAYGVNATPSAVLVASDGTVRSAPVAGSVAIESLIRLALRDETRTAPARG